MTIGVGPQVQQDFLSGLASSPSDYHFCSQSVELDANWKTALQFGNQISRFHHMKRT